MSVGFAVDARQLDGPVRVAESSSWVCMRAMTVYTTSSQAWVADSGAASSRRSARANQPAPTEAADLRKAKYVRRKATFAAMTGRSVSRYRERVLKDLRGCVRLSCPPGRLTLELEVLGSRALPSGPQR